MSNTVCRNLTERPHIAGKEQNRDVANMIYTTHLQYNFDRVEMRNYSVLLSYVNRSNYNVLQIRSNGDVVYVAETVQEEPLTEGEANPNVPPPYNSYSAAGNVTVSVYHMAVTCM